MSDQVLVTRSYLEDTGDAIREKLETDLAYTPAEFGAAIRSIEGGASEDAVKYTEQTPTAAEQAQARTNIVAAKNAAFTGGETVAVQRNGARIIVNDTIDAKLPAFTLYGKSVQAGTPSPEDPADIATAGSAGNVVLSSTNGNLFNPAYLLGATGWTEQNGVYSGDALALFNRFQAAAWIPDTPAGTPLTISGRAIVPTGVQWPRFAFQYSDGTVQNVNISTGSSFSAFSGTSDPSKIISRIIFTYSGSTSDVVTLTDLRISIGAETIALDYVAPITVTLPTPNGLPGIPVASGGNYTDAGGQQWICDTIDKAAGVYTQRVGKVVWDGSSDESWAPQPGWSLPGFSIYVGDSTIQTDITKPPNVLCDRLPAIPTNASYGQYDALVSMTNNAPAYQVAIRGYSAEADFRAYLDTHNITMLYPLATPVVTPLTAAQIAALDALRSHEGQTAIYTTDAVGPEMAVSLLTGVSGGTGIVPAPDSGSQYLGSDGAWHTPDDTPTANSDSLITSGAVQAAIAALTARIEALEGGA